MSQDERSSKGCLCKAEDRLVPRVAPKSIQRGGKPLPLQAKVLVMEIDLAIEIAQNVGPCSL